MDWRPSAALETLRARQAMLSATRRFFSQHGVLEVDTPVLQGGANVDPGSQSLMVACGAERRFLPTSPEHPLKRLVAAGYGAVWALAPAFRMGERSHRHQPEFRMLEWYRPGWDERQLLDEVLALLALLTGWDRACEVITYREAFIRHVAIDPEHVGSAQLAELAHGAGAEIAADRDAAIDWLLATRIEPHLGRERFTALTGYPQRLAAQARLRMEADGVRVAARFELYWRGIELANGYHELSDAAELAARLGQERSHRQDSTLAPDHRFESAMRAGLPDCAGVALGFDRVLMLTLGLTEVAQTMAFSWDLA